MEDERESWAETVAAPPSEILKLLILQKREESILEIKNYYYRTDRGIEGKLHKVRARVKALFLELQSSLQANIKPEEYDLLVKQLNADKIESLESAFYYINKWLYDKKVLRFDTRGGYDASSLKSVLVHKRNSVS